MTKAPSPASSKRALTDGGRFLSTQHSTGFPGSDHNNNDTTVYFPGYLAQMMATLAQSRLNTTPGYMSVYCNDGFTLVEALVANVTGSFLLLYGPAGTSNVATVAAG